MEEIENQEYKTPEVSVTNGSFKIFDKQFEINWEQVRSLDDLIMIMKAMNITIHWYSDECPEQFKEIYNKRFLIEKK